MARSKKTIDDILDTADNLLAALQEEQDPQPEGTITPRQDAEVKKIILRAAGEKVLRLYRAEKMDWKLITQDSLPSNSKTSLRQWGLIG